MVVVLERFHDLTMSPAFCVAFRVYLHHVHSIACIPLRITGQLASPFGHLHHMFLSDFVQVSAPDWYLIRCRSSFSQPCMTETAGRVTPLHMLA